MTETKIIKPDRETADDTKAGNYFIANYPPFSFWNEKDIPCVESLLNSPLRVRHHWAFIIIFHSVESAVTFVTFVSIPIKIP